MSYSNDINPREYFAFNDIVGFRDYVGYVYGCAPDMFPEEDWLQPHEQMNMKIAFCGLRYGLEIIEKEKGQSQRIEAMRELIDQAEEAYRANDIRGGMEKMDKVRAMLSLF